MNTSKKSNIIMNELLDIVGGSAVGGINPVDQTVTNTNQDELKSKESGPLTVQDVINQLTEMVRENPESAEYQIAEYDYDDFAVGPEYSIFSLKSINVIDLPENSEVEFVDDELISDKIAIFSIH